MKKALLLLLTGALIFTSGCFRGHQINAGYPPGGGGLPPNAPLGLTATAGDAQVVLQWNAVVGALSYNIYYSTSPGVSKLLGTKVNAGVFTTYTLTGLTNGTTYYFVVTAVNGNGESGESVTSNEANATPNSPGACLDLTPGTAASATVKFSAANSLTFQFPANAVSAAANVCISVVTQDALAAPLKNAKDTFILAFDVVITPSTITGFNAPVTVSGGVDTTVSPVGDTLNLDLLSGTPCVTTASSPTTSCTQSWMDVATLVVGAKGALAENLASVTLPGLLTSGHFLMYLPAPGTSTAISNFGVVLIADDGYGMADGKNGLQVINIYDSKGNLLTTPTVVDLDYPGEGDLDGQAMTPDGSQGIMVDGSSTLSFFSGVQTGTPVATANGLDVSTWGDDGDSVGILPTGDEAAVSLDSNSQLVIVSGILSGNPVVATTLDLPNDRDGLVVSADGKVLLARGFDGLTVFSIAEITPTAGSIGGTLTHSYTQVTDLPTLASDFTEDGRDGMAISPTDSSRAAVVFYGYNDGSYTNGSVLLLTGLPGNPVAGTAVPLPTGAYATSVAISPDGKLAVVGTYDMGLFLFSGVDTGTLTMVGGSYAPTYAIGESSNTLQYVTTLGITLDGKYVVVGDVEDQALVVVPFTAAGFAAVPATAVSAAIPDNDQLLIH